MKILICPICKSDKVGLYLGGYAGMLYQCVSCGYIGPVVIEVNDLDTLKELEELSEETANGSVEREYVDEYEKMPVKKTRRGGFK